MNPLRPTVLLVDDDRLIRDVLSRILTRRYDIIPAASAEEAIEVINDRMLSNQTVDVILSDIMMPGIGGQGLLPRLPKALQQRLLFMTGGFLRDDVHRFLERAGRPVLFKPISHLDLFENIQAILGPLPTPEPVPRRVAASC